MTNEKVIRSRERQVINLVSSAHFFSHFYLLCLPPLFLTIKNDLGITFTDLGVIVSVYAMGSFSGQYPMGVLADRYGPRWILILGMLTVASSFILFGLFPIYPVMVVLALLAGLGDSVFHPANFAVLTASVSSKRVGRAYAFHAFAGFAGFAAAPIAIDTLRVLLNWHVALIAVGLLGLVMTLVLYLNRRKLIGETHRQSMKQEDRRQVQENTKGMGVIEFIKFPPILILFFFYVAVALAGSGIQHFSPSALPQMYGVNITDANKVLFFYMISISIGILVGGYVADKFTRLDIVATIGYLIGIFMVCVVAMNIISFFSAAIALVLAAFMMGIVMPSRDVLVRTVTPKGNAGKAFGFVNSGFGLAGVVGPIIFGRIMDMGHVTWIYFGAAIFMGVTIVAALAAGRYAAAGLRS